MSTQAYLDLVTSEHQEKPQFAATLQALLQPVVEVAETVANLRQKFDLDTAVGVQLDVVGEWVGRSRYLSVPLTDVYFSFDTAGVGFDEGTWLGPYDPVSGLVSLPDEDYRLLLRAKIINNHWDGTVPGGYLGLDELFPGNTPILQDYGDMSMMLGLIDTIPLTAVTRALLTGGYLPLKPVGVRIAYALPSVPGSSMFGFDAENDTVAGFDTGVFATVIGE